MTDRNLAANHAQGVSTLTRAHGHDRSCFASATSRRHRGEPSQRKRLVEKPGIGQTTDVAGIISSAGWSRLDEPIAFVSVGWKSAMMKLQSPQQFMRLNQREMIQRFVDPKAGFPVATNNLAIAARMFNGEIKQCGRDAAMIMPAAGLPKLFVATKRDDYRHLSLSAFEQIGISMRGPLQFDVDHALARSLSFGRYEYVLMNPVSCLPNRSFGWFEKQSRDRVFKDKTLESASITEILKICEIAPARRGNLAEDLIIAIQTAREAGLINKEEMGFMFDAVRNSDNNVVSEAYTENRADFERIVKSIK